ncbi:MAG: FadR/GntR family transcriptional regulator [Peptococcaceae bacterium]
MFQPINQEQDSVYEKVVKRLKSSIAEGKLKPGDKLPAERVLAQMLGISRTSLREALKLLSAEGLVDIKHGKGVFIAEQETDDIIQKFSAKIFIENNTLKDFFEIRKVLETQAAMWAAERSSQEQIIDLESIVTKTFAELTASKKFDYAILAEHDMKFHNCLAEASGNAVLIRIMQNLIDLLTETRSHALSVPKRPYHSIEEHLEIIKAIKERSSAKAGNAMLIHLRNVEKDIFPNN